MASKKGAEVHRRLREGQPPEVVAEAAGLAVSSVYVHRAGKCQCVEREQRPELEDGLPSVVLPDFEELPPARPVVLMEQPTLEQLRAWNAAEGPGPRMSESELEGLHEIIARDAGFWPRLRAQARNW